MPLHESIQINPVEELLKAIGITHGQDTALVWQRVVWAIEEHNRKVQESTEMSNELVCTCPITTAGRNHLPNCVNNPLIYTSPLVAPIGWTCPVCNGGVSPFTTRCPCKPLPAVVFSVAAPS